VKLITSVAVGVAFRSCGELLVSICHRVLLLKQALDACHLSRFANIDLDWDEDIAQLSTELATIKQIYKQI
jgi:hypothetical protein